MPTTTPIFQCPLNSTVYPYFKGHSRAVETLPLSARSLLINLCQAQAYPSQDSVLRRRMIEHPAIVLPNGDVVRLEEYFTRFHNDLHSPVKSAIILDLCRSLPLPPSEIELARAKGWTKEILPCSTETKKTSFYNWMTIFDTQQAHIPLSPYHPPNEGMAAYIHFQLHRLRTKYRNKTLLPRATHKQMSYDTRRSYESESGDTLDYTTIFGQDDWCRYYHETGIQLEGVCEMRQKWYPSGAKPRTYYAQGGTSYRHSRFLQDFFTDLANALTSTHHVFRLMPSRLRPSSDEAVFRIYDLSSFTSRMEEQKFFVQALATFFMGVPVKYLDEVHGVCEVDLGELLEEYNEVCNWYPEVSLERCLKEQIVISHSLASMLGIFGNLMTCTSAHGISVLMLHQSELHDNVAGDDGLDDETDSGGHLPGVIESLGIVEWTKTYPSTDPYPVCLKRPLLVSASGVDLGLNVVPPNLALVNNLLGIRDDPRYTFYHDDLTRDDRRTIIGRDLLRFLDSARRCPHLEPEDKRIVVEVYWVLTRAFENPKPSLVICGDEYDWPIPPNDVEFPCNVSFLELTFRIRFRDYLYVPVETFDEFDVRLCCTPGDTLSCRPSKYTSWLRRLGYLKDEPRMSLLLGNSAVEYFEKHHAAGRLLLPSSSTFLCLKEIPNKYIIYNQ
jgi:hypothetical protein